MGYGQAMETLTRPDGATISYEVEGSGFPVLLFAPGGYSSESWTWRDVSALKPFDMTDEFMMIGMNQRHTNGSPGPLAAPDWATMAADQRAILDDLGIERALLWGGCIGVGYGLRFISEAPERVAGAVFQDPVGLVDGFNDRSTFSAMLEPTIALAQSDGLEAVIAAAEDNSIFVRNHPAGPFSGRLGNDKGFQAEVLALGVDGYVALMHQWDDNIWGAEGPFMSVPEAYLPTCQTPMLIVPGNDPFHPTATSLAICEQAPNATCLDVDCRSDDKLAATTQTVREFLRANAD